MSLASRSAARAGHFYRRWARRRAFDGPAAVAELALRRVRAAKYCLVVTDAECGPSARVVEPFRPARDGTIRFGTDPASRKIADIRRTGRCLLVYQNDRTRSCVSIECEAAPEEWPGDAPPRFKPMWVAFWPAGPTPASYVVVACTPTAMEVWDGTAVVAPEPFGRRGVRLVRVGREWRHEDR